MPIENGYYWYQGKPDEPLTIIEIEDDTVFYMGGDEIDYSRDLKGKIIKKIEYPIFKEDLNA